MAEHASKIFYAVVALVALGLLGGGLVAAGSEGLSFGFFATLTIGGGLIVVWDRSVVHSAFALMATLLGVAGLFLLLHADFLAVAQVLIYVGGILVLILFGVMLAPPNLEERQLPRLLGALALVGGGFGWVAFKVAATANWALAAPPEPTGVSNAQRIGVGFLAADQYVVAFELAAVVLTVALVAAVYIARRRKADLEPEVRSEETV